MGNVVHLTRQCISPKCQFRFPVYGKYLSLSLCPKCGSPTKIVEEINDSPIVPPSQSAANNIILECILDNIRSAFNVGSMFRTADGAGLNHLHLCGMTATPEHSKVAKTALGAEFSIPWTYYESNISAAELLLKNGFRLWALEGGKNAQSIYKAARNIQEKQTVLIIGNEVSGVDPGLLTRCERTIYIPMSGYKRSLNVAIAFGIAVYTLKYIYQV